MGEYKNFFNDKEAAQKSMQTLLHLVEQMATRHGIPFLAVFEEQGMLACYRHFPDGETPSELKSAWYEIAGE